MKFCILPSGKRQKVKRNGSVSRVRERSGLRRLGKATSVAGSTLKKLNGKFAPYPLSLQMLKSRSLRREMQEEDETLQGMIDHDGLTSSMVTEQLATEQVIPNACAENRGLRQDPNECIDNSGHKTEEGPDEFDFSLPPKGRKHRKTKTKKHLDINDEAEDVSIEGKGKRRQRMSGMNDESISTSGTGKCKRLVVRTILIRSSVPGCSPRADPGSGTNIKERQA